MDRGAWWATVHGVSESDMTAQAHEPSQPSAVLRADVYDLLFHYFLLNQSMV